MNFADEVRIKHPHPGDDPVARLRHALDVYEASPDDRVVLDVVGLGVYPEGATTLTLGDLRALARLIGA
ncbi:hypothetical protein [Actinoplanes sp. NPDC051494]|uniref:hypothetical protein n=1 Tax=Actinoplanes sp. NPDC051494 TaxID=3363907 RepID=UPI0037A2B7AA